MKRDDLLNLCALGVIDGKKYDNIMKVELAIMEEINKLKNYDIPAINLKEDPIKHARKITIKSLYKDVKGVKTTHVKDDYIMFIRDGVEYSLTFNITEFGAFGLKMYCSPFDNPHHNSSEIEWDQSYRWLAKLREFNKCHDKYEILIRELEELNTKEYNA